MEYKYEVALSFAGEDRSSADAVAKGLRDAGINIFYDDFYAEELWGEDLAVKLREVYHSSSQFCIMIISEHYVDKMWPTPSELADRIKLALTRHQAPEKWTVRMETMSAKTQRLAVTHSRTKGG